MRKNTHKKEVDKPLGPNTDKVKKSFVIERRFIGDFNELSPMFKFLYENQDKWHNYRKFASLKAAEQSLKHMLTNSHYGQVVTDWEFRIK